MHYTVMIKVISDRESCPNATTAGRTLVTAFAAASTAVDNHRLQLCIVIQIVFTKSKKTR